MRINVICLILFCDYLGISALWENDVSCPRVCTCRLERFSETAIHRFFNKNAQKNSDQDFHKNDVFYDDDFEKDDPFLRTAVCILQTGTDLLDLATQLPTDIESLTLIQGLLSGNKSIKTDSLKNFKELTILEIQGGNFLFEIGAPLAQIKYLNLDQVSLKYSKKKFQLFKNDKAVFEYTQQLYSDSHPLTLVQKETHGEIVPYNKYKEQKDKEEPFFVGFNNLILLRIANSNLSSINWEMFDGLQTLKYLLLERNALKFIPDFAFYGVPNLQTLSLAWNNLLSIQVTDLAGLLELEYLDLRYNNFSQLSELSFPPFPKLKLANFGDNPINVVFPNTFEVMNTTDSLVLGGRGTPLSLLPNSFLGLKLLQQLTLQNLIVPVLKRELLIGMPNLNELIMTGNISKIEFDSFLEVTKLERLFLSECSISNISMDAFIGLNQLKTLDLSKNQLEYVPPGIFDELISLKELYLNDNKFPQLSIDIFTKIHPKLIRLNENPWHCSCKMSSWKPMIVNKIKQKTLEMCDFKHDKGVGCTKENVITYKYVYENRVAPRCTTPRKFLNWSVFHVMRRELKCPDYKPKLKKSNLENVVIKNNTTVKKILKESDPPPVILSLNDEDNDLMNNLQDSFKIKQQHNANISQHIVRYKKIKKFKKKSIM